MDTANAIASPRGSWGSEDTLRVLGRVADAFDNPSSQKVMDKELKLFVVNVVRTRHLMAGYPSEESVWDHACCETRYDEMELGHPDGSGRSLSKQGYSRKQLPQDDTMIYDVTKMLLTSSPLDRLDRLARVELKKTGWVERVDKWTLVEMGLQGVPQTATPPKTPSRKAGGNVDESWERLGSPKAPRYGDDTRRRPERRAMRSPDFDSRTRHSRAFLPEQTRGRLGEVVRNIMRRMLLASGTGHARTVQTRLKGGIGVYSPTELTPRSDETGWTAGSGRSQDEKCNYMYF